MNRLDIIRILLIGAVLVCTMGATAQADVTAYVVHGIDGDDFGLDPELPVDVFVSGLGCALPGFTFGDRVGPIVVPAGDYDISVFLADGDEPCTGAEVIDLDGVTLPDGANATVIAHRTFDGSTGAGDLLDLGITASIFANDFSPTERGKARVIVQHTALAPTIDVVVSRDYSDPTAPGVTVPDFTNPTASDEAVLSQINAQFRPGLWEATLEVDGAPVFGPTPLNLRPFTTTYIYAVGDFAGGTFQYLVYTEAPDVAPGPVRNERAPRGARKPLRR